MPSFELPPAKPQNPNIMIGIPSYGDLTYDELAILLLRLGTKFQLLGAGLTLHCGGRTWIEKSRNIIASLFFGDGAFTHLLFVDSEMSFSPDLVMQMIAFDKPFIGVALPARQVSWPSMHRAADLSENPEELAALGH